MVLTGPWPPRTSSRHVPEVPPGGRRIGRCLGRWYQVRRQITANPSSWSKITPSVRGSSSKNFTLNLGPGQIGKATSSSCLPASESCKNPLNLFLDLQLVLPPAFSTREESQAYASSPQSFQVFHHFQALPPSSGARPARGRARCRPARGHGGRGGHVGGSDPSIGCIASSSRPWISNRTNR